MTGPRSDPKDVKATENQQLDRVLEEGLEETFPRLRPGECDPAAALESRPSHQAEGLARRPIAVRSRA
jgi:hypothetical protein